jgi:anti-anti-sigma regulatory factor
VVEADGQPGAYALRGELDVAGLSTLLSLPVAPEPNDVVIFDLSELTFVDSSGLGALIQLRRKVIDSNAHGAARSCQKPPAVYVGGPLWAGASATVVAASTG